MSKRTATDLEQFDQMYLELGKQTPFVPVIVALWGLTRLGERPVSLERLAAVVDRPVQETEAIVRRNFVVRIEDGLVHWDDPFPGEQTRRVVYIGDRAVAMGSGCGPDTILLAAVFDVPFRVEETCPATGAPIGIDFVPDGVVGVVGVDPPEAVTMLLHPDEIREGGNGTYDMGTFAESNAHGCSYQPFFASAEAAKPSLAAHPGSRTFPIEENFQRPWYRYYRDLLRPRIHA